MSFTEKRLCNPTQLTTSGQTLYTVPSSKTAIVKQIVVTNVTGSSATFSLFIGSAATPNALFSATSVAANDAIVINLSQVLNSTEILTALASANSTLNITISGVENDGPLNPLSTYIADGAITTAKLADSSVTTAKIAAGAVVNADIADNAVTQTKLSTDVPLSGMRNAIINGDFRVNQRGLTSSGTTTQLYSGYDRWLWVATGGTVTYSAQPFSTGNAISGYEPKNFARLAISGQSASGDFCLFAQKIEDARTFAGQQVTLSFWAKSATGTPSVAVELDQSFGTGGSSSVQTYITKIPITTSWARYTATFTVPSISGKTVGSGTDSYLGLNLWYSSGAGTGARTGSLGIQNNTFDIWGVQLEQNTQPTPFEQRPYGVELALCQRYYYRATGGGLYYRFGIGPAQTADNFYPIVQFPVPMRKNPDQLDTSAMSTFGMYNSSSANTTTPTSITLSSSDVSPYSTTLAVAKTAGYTITYVYTLYANNTTSAYIGFSAEL